MPVRLFVERGTITRGVRPQTLRERSRRLLEQLGLTDWHLTVVLVDAAEMRRLNRHHRHIDRATDVLSFPIDAPSAGSRRAPGGPPRILGDVVVNADAARQQAADPGSWARAHAGRRSSPWSAMAEATLLVIHGVLHLCGSEHRKRGNSKRMQARERDLMDRIAPERGRRRRASATASRRR